jgi:hypothetical protein
MLVLLIVHAPNLIIFACLFIICILTESFSRYTETVGRDVHLKLTKVCEEQTASYPGLAFRAIIEVNTRRSCRIIVVQVKRYFIEIMIREER